MLCSFVLGGVDALAAATAAHFKVHPTLLPSLYFTPTTSHPLSTKPLSDGRRWACEPSRRHQGRGRRRRLLLCVSGGVSYVSA